MAYQTGTYGYDGSGTATTTVANLAPVTTPVRYIIIQNDPASLGNLLVGFTSSPALVLIPGASLSVPVGNLNNIWYQAATVNVTFHWSAAQL